MTRTRNFTAVSKIGNLCSKIPSKVCHASAKSWTSKVWQPWVTNANSSSPPFKFNMHHDVNQWRSTSVQRWRSCVTRLAGPDYSRSPLYRNPSNLLKDPLSATDVVTLNSLIPQLLTFRLGIIGVIAVIPDPFWKRIVSPRSLHRDDTLRDNSPGIVSEILWSSRLNIAAFWASVTS